MVATAHRLKISLQHLRACNAVLVKLVDQEDLMAEIEDSPSADSFHRRKRPNISVRHVTFTGKHVVLPDGMALSC